MSTAQYTTNQDRPRLALLFCVASLALVLAGCTDSPEKLEREAKAHLAKGDRVSASIYYKSLLTLEPAHADAQFQLGRLLAGTGELREAESGLRRALELGKPLEEVGPVLALALLELEKFKEVLELLEPDPKRAQPADPKALGELALLRGRAYFGQGELTSAGTQFQLAMDGQAEKAKLGLARIAALRNERARAEELIAEVLASNPQEVDAHLALGELKRNAGEMDKALPHYAEAVRLQPDNVNAVLHHAIALIITNRTDEARTFLDTARKLAPAMPLLHFANAMIECKARRYGPCGEALQKVFDVMPNYMPAVLLAGQLSFSTGNFELAQVAFMRYLERFPRNTYAGKMLAATLLANGQAAAAFSVLQPLLKANVEDAAMLGIAGQALLHLGHLRQARAALVRAVKLAPDDAEFHTALALVHLASGMRGRAEADFRTAIALKPPGTRADYALIMMLLAEKKMEPALEVAAAAVKRLPNSPEAHMLKGVVSRAAGDKRGALQGLTRAVELDRDFFPAVEELARMDVQDGKPDVARIRVQGVLSRNRNHLGALLTMARIDFAAGRRADGLSWARQAADAHPKSTQAMLLIAETQLEAGEATEAIGSARQALSLRPRDAQVLRALGQAQMATKDYVGAATTFSNLASAQPGSMEAHLLLATAHLSSGDVTTAVSVARNAVKRNPRSSEAWAVLAEVLLHGKKYGEALEFAHQVQRQSPQSALGYRLEGEALLAQGDARRAVKPFETAMKLEPTGLLLTRVHQAQFRSEPGSASDRPLEEWVKKNPDDIVTRMYLADTLSATGRHKDAIAHYLELIRRDAKDVRALNNLAWALHATGDPQALNYAEQAYQLRPTEAAVVDTFGWALVNRGRLQEGIPMLLKAVTLDGKNPEIRYHLAKALAQAGDKTRARRELKIALDAGTPFPQAQEARKLLVSLGQ